MTGIEVVDIVDGARGLHIGRQDSPAGTCASLAAIAELRAGMMQQLPGRAEAHRHQDEIAIDR